MQVGDNVDASLRNGPTADRHCRDCICCLMFIASTIAMIAIFGYALGNGNPSNLAQPYDSAGNRCGKPDTDYSDYQYLYYAVPLPGYLSRTVCVKECPSSTTETVECKSITYEDMSADQKATGYFKDTFKIGEDDKCTKVTNDALVNIDISTLTVTGSTSLSFDTAFWLYGSKGIFGRVCVPSSDTILEYANDLFDDIQDNLKVLQKWVSDVLLTWPIILSSCAFALVIGFVYMILMRYCVGIMVWLAIFLYFLAILLLSIFFYQRGQDIQDNKEREEVDSDSTETSTSIAYFLWVVLGISLILLMCFYTRIKLAIAILKTASQFVTDVKTSLIVPIVISILLIAFWVVWTIGFFYGYSVGDVKVNSYGFSSVEWESSTRYMLVYYVFGGLWKNAWILAVEQFVLAHAVCLWYFTKEQGLHSPIWVGIKRALWYHCGSLAFGAFILAVIQLVRLILTYIQKTCEKNALSENKFVKCFIWSTQCYLACLERFVKFINKNAYIQIALNGKSFCMAAKDAFSIIMANPARFATVNTIGTIFLFLGKIFIGAGSACIGYLIITNVDTYEEELFSAFLPTLLMFIIGYSVGILFMGIYGLAIDAILHCFILDESIAKQHGGGQVFTPEYLKDFIDQNEEKVKENLKRQQELERKKIQPQ